jgi:hypothetical protein
MKNFNLIALLSGFILTYCYESTSKANTFNPCEDFLIQSNGLQAQGLVKSNKIDCMILIHPIEKPDLKYRSFIFDTSGSFLVFNSFSTGSEATQTGARLFYIFPREQELSYQILPNEDFQVQTRSGEIFTFDSKTAHIKDISNSKFVEDPKIHSQNKGGVEILEFPHLLLDLGFMIGNDPRSNKKGKGLFRFSKKNCQVSNSEIIDYLNPNETPLKYKGDEELTAFLKNRCPNL